MTEESSSWEVLARLSNSRVQAVLAEHHKGNQPAANVIQVVGVIECDCDDIGKHRSMFIVTDRMPASDIVHSRRSK